MSSKSFLSALCLTGSVLTFSACSSGGYADSRYQDDYSGGGYYTGTGAEQMGQYAGGADCLGANSGQVYVSSRYGDATSSVSYGTQTVTKSRYGSYESSTGAGCGGGYYMAPAYQVMQQPMVPAALPEPSSVPVYEPAPVTSVPSITIEETTCPDGQYKMTNGDCAIMQTEQYVPPVISGYVEPVRTPVEYYDPIRK